MPNSVVVEKPRVSPAENQGPQVGWGSWFSWVLVSTGGWLLGSAVSVPIITVGGGIMFIAGFSLRYHHNDAMAEFIVFLVMVVVFLVVSGGAGVAAGAAVGAAQWLVLRQKVPQARGWVKASVLGLLVVGVVILGTFLGLDTGIDVLGTGRAWQLSRVRIPVAGAIFGAAAGAVFGAAQWRVLRGTVSQAGWWVPANALGWAMGWVLGWWVLFGSLGRAVGQAVGLWAVGWQVPGGGWRWLGGLEYLLALVEFGFVAACITGVALVWHLRQPGPDAYPW